MKFLKLFLRMLRLRVAITLVLFFLFGISQAQGLRVFKIDYLWAFLAILFSYLCATTVNDISDRKIDAINHKQSKARLLVTGEAKVSDFLIIHVFSLFFSLFFGYLCGLPALYIVSISLAINYFYSLGLKISHNAYLAPLLLSIAYVILPYWIGFYIASGIFNFPLNSLLIALLLLFMGRIVLKDFRDRKGDRKYSKMTFILKHGKSATCLLSFGLILFGNLFLFIYFLGTPFIFVILEFYFIAIYYCGYRLFSADSFFEEQVFIGIGAKMGNGLMLNILCLLLLNEYNTSFTNQVLFSIIVLGLFAWSFVSLILKPKDAILGYRG